MSHYSPFPRDRRIIELSSRDNSNFLSPNYHIIITIISKFGQNFYKMIWKYIFVPNIDTKKLGSFSKVSPYMIHNWTHLS
jgi:hypothetical protein